MDHSTVASGSVEMSFCPHLLGKDSPILAENPNGEAEKDIVLFSDSFEELWEGFKDPTRTAPVSVLQPAGGCCGKTGTPDLTWLAEVP